MNDRTVEAALITEPYNVSLRLSLWAPRASVCDYRLLCVKIMRLSLKIVIGAVCTMSPAFSSQSKSPLFCSYDTDARRPVHHILDLPRTLTKVVFWDPSLVGKNASEVLDFQGEDSSSALSPQSLIRKADLIEASGISPGILQRGTFEANWRLKTLDGQMPLFPPSSEITRPFGIREELPTAERIDHTSVSPRRLNPEWCLSPQELQRIHRKLFPKVTESASSTRASTTRNTKETLPSSWPERFLRIFTGLRCGSSPPELDLFEVEVLSSESPSEPPPQLDLFEVEVLSSESPSEPPTEVESDTHESTASVSSELCSSDSVLSSVVLTSPSKWSDASLADLDMYNLKLENPQESNPEAWIFHLTPKAMVEPRQRYNIPKPLLGCSELLHDSMTSVPLVQYVFDWRGEVNRITFDHEAAALEREFIQRLPKRATSRTAHETDGFSAVKEKPPKWDRFGIDRRCDFCQIRDQMGARKHLWRTRLAHLWSNRQRKFKPLVPVAVPVLIRRDNLLSWRHRVLLAFKQVEGTNRKIAAAQIRRPKPLRRLELLRIRDPNAYPEETIVIHTRRGHERRAAAKARRFIRRGHKQSPVWTALNNMRNTIKRGLWVALKPLDYGVRAGLLRRKLAKLGNECSCNRVVHLTRRQHHLRIQKLRRQQLELHKRKWKAQVRKEHLQKQQTEKSNISYVSASAQRLYLAIERLAKGGAPPAKQHRRKRQRYHHPLYPAIPPHKAHRWLLGLESRRCTNMEGMELRRRKERRRLREKNVADLRGISGLRKAGLLGTKDTSRRTPTRILLETPPEPPLPNDGAVQRILSDFKMGDGRISWRGQKIKPPRHRFRTSDLPPQLISEIDPKRAPPTPIILTKAVDRQLKLDKRQNRSRILRGKQLLEYFRERLQVRKQVGEVIDYLSEAVQRRSLSERRRSLKIKRAGPITRKRVLRRRPRYPVRLGQQRLRVSYLQSRLHPSELPRAVLTTKYPVSISEARGDAPTEAKAPAGPPKAHTRQKSLHAVVKHASRLRVPRGALPAGESVQELTSRPRCPFVPQCMQTVEENAVRSFSLRISDNPIPKGNFSEMACLENGVLQRYPLPYLPPLEVSNFPLYKPGSVGAILAEDVRQYIVKSASQVYFSRRQPVKTVTEARMCLGSHFLNQMHALLFLAETTLQDIARLADAGGDLYPLRLVTRELALHVVASNLSGKWRLPNREDAKIALNDAIHLRLMMLKKITRLEIAQSEDSGEPLHTNLLAAEVNEMKERLLDAETKRDRKMQEPRFRLGAQFVREVGRQLLGLSPRMSAEEVLAFRGCYEAKWPFPMLKDTGGEHYVPSLLGLVHWWIHEENRVTGGFPSIVHGPLRSIITFICVPASQRQRRLQLLATATFCDMKPTEGTCADSMVKALDSRRLLIDFYLKFPFADSNPPEGNFFRGVRCRGDHDLMHSAEQHSEPASKKRSRRAQRIRYRAAFWLGRRAERRSLKAAHINIYNPI
ncbi:MAG: uncharacterized protein KVP18_003911, partial [Porospora cf. gigantea A]|uniref:uncharacterized protein n=1 Tax=Porospora cf. gigantea A TaxID=2853593 RepID=UPI00355A59C9